MKILHSLYFNLLEIEEEEKQCKEIEKIIDEDSSSLQNQYTDFKKFSIILPFDISH